MNFRLDWHWFFGRDTTDPRRMDSRGLARLCIGLASAILAVDIYGLARIQAFASGSPEVVQASGRAWIETGRRGVSWILLETGHGSFRLGAAAPGVASGSSSRVGSSDLIKGGWTAIAWIDAPACCFNATTHYPVRLEQNGRRLIDLTAPQVAEEQRHQVLLEAALVAGLMFAPSVLWLLLGYRRHQAGMTTARKAWHERRARRDEHSN